MLLLPGMNRMNEKFKVSETPLIGFELVCIVLRSIRPSLGPIKCPEGALVDRYICSKYVLGVSNILYPL